MSSSLTRNDVLKPQLRRTLDACDALAAERRAKRFTIHAREVSSLSGYSLNRTREALRQLDVLGFVQWSGEFCQGRRRAEIEILK